LHCQKLPLDLLRRKPTFQSLREIEAFAIAVCLGEGSSLFLDFRLVLHIGLIGIIVMIPYFDVSLQVHHSQGLMPPQRICAPTTFCLEPIHDRTNSIATRAI
jgi:hypothetical protein